MNQIVTLLRNNSKKTFSMIAIIFFVSYFVVGLICVDDYGITVDEVHQRRHSLVTYKYLNEKLLYRSIDALSRLPDLEEYDQYYGVALQIPLVVIEDLFDFELESRTVYLIRHFYTFLICFLGYVFLYLSLCRLMKDDRMIPLLGTMMVALYPRFFSLQFTDIKDLLFVAVNMICIYFLNATVEKDTLLSVIVYGFMSALATNVRPMAVYFPVILLGYWLILDLIDVVYRYGNKTVKTDGDIHWVYRLFRYILLIMSYAVFWVVLTPKSWNEPIKAFVSTFKGFSNYEKWDGTMVFMGRLITCGEMPWYYLPVWFLISIPLVYLALFLIGQASIVRTMFKTGSGSRDWLATYKWPLCMTLLFWGPLLTVIVMHSRIYVGWHHMYFVFVPFCIIACYGVQVVSKRIRFKIMIILIAVYFLLTCGWIGYNHPYEAAYLNMAGRPFGAYFDREETRPSIYAGLRWILENDPGQIVMYCENTNTVALLGEDDKARVTVVEDESEADYVIESYRNVIGNDPQHEGFKEVYDIMVDGYKICSVFKRTEGELK